jgi:hypothetical protein
LYPEFDVKFASSIFLDIQPPRPKLMKIITVTMKKRKTALAFP